MMSSRLSEIPKNEWPLVSLVTPSFNSGPYLAATIESVLGQDYPNIEYLVMDGGSTDGTVELLKGFDTRLRWVSAKDAGQSDAIARGFEQTTGTIISWLNADDVLKPGAVRTAVETFRAHPEAALIYGNADFIAADGRPLGACTVVEPYSQHRLIHYGDYIIQPAAFFSRQAYEAVGGLNKSLHWAMDWDLWIRLARRYDVVYIEEELASYRWLGSNKTAEGGFDRLREIEHVARQYGCNGLPAYFRLEQARLYTLRASRDLQQMQLVSMFNHLAKSALTILSSPRAMKSLLTPHVWRNFRTAQALYRHVAEANAERS